MEFMTPERTSSSLRGAREAHAQPAPSFRTLDATECEQLLSRNHVARIAYSFHDRVDIEPVHYVYDRGSMFGRISPGSKLTTLTHNHWMAAEVDEVDGLFDWRSVVVHGSLYTVSPDVPGAEAAAWARGIELLRTLVPETGTADDPVRFRSIIFQVHVDETSGRSATPGNR
jgi:nitroimidazol reductase NimA-like FMN-containing flavoprotein (pyridoxamine 5'-phosphate oxidase superfamily)